MNTIKTYVLQFIAIVAASFLSVCALELPWNTHFFEMNWDSFEIEFTLVLGVLTALYFLFQRRALGAGLGVVFFTVLGIIQHFVLLYKSSVISPADLFAVQTALSIAGTYSYYPDAACVKSIVCCIAALLVLFAAQYFTRDYRREHKQKALVNIIIVIAVVAGIFAGVTVPSYEDDLDIKVDPWYRFESYCKHGFLPSFVSSAQKMSVEGPQDYTVEEAQSAVSELASTYEGSRSKEADEVSVQFEELQPSVIAVMNESFCDLSSLRELESGYKGPEFFNSDIEGTIDKGSLLVSTCGGGTCNTEFEFLTGISMSAVGNGLYPYSLYSMKKSESITKQFAAKGYKTTAMHPNLASNWNRSSVYRDMGFDQFLSIDDFEGAELVRNRVSDAATYEKILELLEHDDSPQFIFDVTMQNHGGYKENNVSGVLDKTYAPVSFDDSETNQDLNEFLACIKISDDALKDFISKLRNVNRPVVLVFFGDHHPGFSPIYNDNMFNDKGMAHSQRTLETEYLIWSNYELDATVAQDSEWVGSSQLAALLFEAVGMQLSDYQKAQLALRSEIPAYGLFGFLGADRSWYVPYYDSPYSTAVRQAQFAEFRQFQIALGKAS